MATSYSVYKREITNYLKQNFDNHVRILDVGAGEGTYLPFLEPYFDNIEAVEVFKPNIDNFNLEERYKKVYNTNILDFEYDFYDIIIFGDIIEHLEVEEAQRVLEYAYNRCTEMVVAVPYLSSQGIEEDNIYEIHKQDDLTDKIMKERYPYLRTVYKNSKYGYYIKEERMKNYIVRVIMNFNDTVEKNEYGLDTPRKINDTFYCTKERYEFLKEHRAVELLGIEKQQTPVEQVENIYKEEVKKASKPKRKKKEVKTDGEI